MTRIFLFFTYCISLCIHSYLVAQPIQELTTPVKMLTVDDGLSQGFVYGAIQDKEGFIWLATPDGLNRYDGYTIKVYRTNAKDPYSLPENFVRQVAEDDNGNLWVSTYSKGLFVFDRITERFYPVIINAIIDENGSINILTLKFQQGRLYIGTYDNMVIANVVSVKSGHYTSSELEHDFKIVTSLKIDDHRSLITQVMPDNTICDYHSNTVTFFTPDAALLNWTAKTFSVKDLGIDSINLTTRFYKYPGENKLCIINESCLYVYDLTLKKMVFRKTGEQFSIADFGNPMCFDGKLYFHPFRSSDIYEFNLSTYEMLKYKDEGNHILLNVYFKDRTGVLWIQTDAQGMVLLNTQLTAFHKSNDIIKRFVRGSKTLVYFDFDRQTFYEYSPATNTIHSISQGIKMGSASKNGEFEFMDHHGNLWYVKNWESIYSYNPKTKYETKLDLDLYWFNLFMFEDHFNHLWISHFGKENDKQIYLSLLNSSFKRVQKQFVFPFATQEKGPFVYASWVNDNNEFWLATDAGLFRFNPQETDSSKAWKHWKHRDNDSLSIASDKLLSICADPKEPGKYLWLGTRGEGMDRFEMATGKCLHFTDKNGLPNNVTYMILPDELGNLWISTNKGLSCFTPPGLTPHPSPKERGRFRNFTEEDGLAGNEFNTYCGKKLATGELFFQGVKGTTWFRPAEVLKQQAAVPIHFISLSVNNQPVDWKTDSTIINENISYCKTITLTHEQNIFSIGFAAMDFRKKSGIHYKYYLEGFDKEWIEAGNKNEATYTNLDPGHYTFHVTGANSDGVWNEKGKTIEIIVLPAWYETIWFKIVVFIFIAGALYGLYRYRLKQAIKMMNLRNRIAGDLHDEIGSTLSSISLYSEAAKKMLNGNEKADKVLSKINTNTSEMMEAMSDIVWAANTRNDKFDNLFNRMRSFAVQVAEAKNMQLHFADNKNLPEISLDMVQRKNLYLIFKEAVNNAAKYSESNNVWVEFSLKHSLLEMKIKDDGKGFEQESGSGETNGRMGGNGFINMQNRAKDINAELKISSVKGNGTEIILKMKR